MLNKVFDFFANFFPPLIFMPSPPSLYEAIIIVFSLHVYATVSRIITLKRELDQKLSEHESAIEADPQDANVQITENDVIQSTSTSGAVEYKLKNINNFNTKDILTMISKSKALEITGLSLWEQIIEEVVVFIIFLSFLAFLGVGFWVLSANSQFISALTSVVIFVVGGGVNIPLGSRTNRTERWEEKLKSEAATQAMSNSKKNQ